VSRSNQQLTRALQQLVRGVQTGKIKLRWIVGIVVLVAGYLLLQPVLQRSLGIDLPGWRDLTTQQSGAPGATQTPDSTKASPDDALEEIYRSGRGTYVSPVGLRYTRGSQQGHRLKHLMAHAEDDPDRPGQHGVFDSDDILEIVALVDTAYESASGGGPDTKTKHEDGRTIYEVNLGRRIGYIGGTSGNRRNHPAANYLRLVIDGDRVITAFPFRP